MLNNKKEMNVEDLKELLLENEVSNFDPVAEAFKIFDPKGEGGCLIVAEVTNLF